MPPRIAVAQLIQESNSFSPLVTTIESFENCYLLRGAQLLTDENRAEVAGFLSVISDAGATPVPILAAMALSGGPVTRPTFELLVGEIEAALIAAGPVDGLLIALHGALVVEDQPDGDGEILERLRRVLGAHVLIGVTLDLHAHITSRMLQPECFLIGYQEFPHTDMYETGQRAARLLIDTLAGRRRPVMGLAKRPIVISPSTARTHGGPFQSIAEAARRLEAEPVLHVSIFPVQPWIDVPDLGFAVLVCSDGNVISARETAESIAELVWRQRRDYEPDLVSIDTAIEIGLSSKGLTVVSDGGDAPTAGSAADDATVLRRLLELGAARAERLSYLTLCDPSAVQYALRAVPGTSVTLDVGHAFSTGSGRPVRITGTLKLASDGEYRMRHQQVMSVRMGLTALVAIGSIRLVLRSLPAIEWDVGSYLSQGLDPDDACLIFVKSPAGFRHSYSRFAERILIADTPGSAPTNLRRVPYKKVTRPLYPLDESFP
jgi:microcystin degradation protein MlrC